MSKIGALRDLLVSLLQEHEHDSAIPTSARFLYYELVQREQLRKQSTGARRPDQNLLLLALPEYVGPVYLQGKLQEQSNPLSGFMGLH
jgi:hypothetical protein